VGCVSSAGDVGLHRQHKNEEKNEPLQIHPPFLSSSATVRGSTCYQWQRRMKPMCCHYSFNPKSFPALFLSSSNFSRLFCEFEEAYFKKFRSLMCFYLFLNFGFLLFVNMFYLFLT
jgi:hypothetical protein